MFKMNIPDAIAECMGVLESNGFEAFLVGGCVRDALMGIQPHDHDMTTSASPDEMLECFKNYRVVPTGLKHGTLTVICRGENVEITTYRIDGKYSDNRHPESVLFTRNLGEDLSRRDFTVNAMAYSPNAGLVDLFGGEAHLAGRKIVCVGEPDVRFGEDGLRIMRGLRFSSVLGFEIEKNTAESIRRNRELLKNIAVERIYSEFSKLLCGCRAADIISNYCDVLQVFLPELDGPRDGIREAFAYLDGVNADLQTRIAVLFARYGISPEAASEIMRRLKTDRDSEICVGMLLADLNTEIQPERISVKRFLKNKSREYATRLFRLRSAAADDCADFANQQKCLEIADGVFDGGECLSLRDLQINGADLLSLGCPKGKRMGDILAVLLDGVIDGDIPNEREKLRESALEFIRFGNNQ